ncbi:MAG: hypothetical protein U0528_16125 [Anaerolineae bacterium]
MSALGFTARSELPDALYRHLYLAYSPPTFADQDVTADADVRLAPIPTTTLLSSADCR